jgi:flagellar hook-length control protein FliK
MNMALPAPIDPAGMESQPSAKSANSQQSVPVGEFKEMLNNISNNETPSGEPDENLAAETSENSDNPIKDESLVTPDVQQDIPIFDIPDLDISISDVLVSDAPVLVASPEFAIPAQPETMVKSDLPGVQQELEFQASVEKPAIQMVAGFNGKNAIYTPVKFSIEPSGDALNNTAIINPIASKNGQDLTSGAGLISGNVPIGDGKIPYEVNSPPDRSNSPSVETEWLKPAGPRGSDLLSQGSTRFTEEAELAKTQREVLSTSTRPPNLMREYFRMPAHEITRGNANHPTNAPQHREIQPNLVAARLVDQSETQFRSYAHEVSRPEIQSQPKQAEILTPVIEPQVKPNENSTVNNEFMGKVTASANRISNAESSSSSNRNSSSGSDSFTTGNQHNAQGTVEHSQDSGKQSSSKQDMSEFDFKVVSRKSESAQSVSNGSSSKAAAQPAVDMNALNAAISTSNGAIRSDSTVVEVKEPVSILGNAPVRIASEIAQAESEGIPNGGKAVLKIELNPPRLGRMNIELVKSDSGIEVKLVVRTIFARELINQRGDEIKSALLEQGVDIRKFEIVDANQNRQDFNRGSSGFNTGQMPYERGGEEAGQGSAEQQVHGNVDDEIDSATDFTPSDTTEPLSVRVGELNVLA